MPAFAGRMPLLGVSFEMPRVGSGFRGRTRVRIRFRRIRCIHRLYRVTRRRFSLAGNVLRLAVMAGRRGRRGTSVIIRRTVMMGRLMAVPVIVRRVMRIVVGRVVRVVRRRRRSVVVKRRRNITARSPGIEDAAVIVAVIVAGT